MVWEKRFGGCVPVVGDVPGEGRDDHECRSEGGGTRSRALSLSKVRNCGWPSLARLTAWSLSSREPRIRSGVTTVLSPRMHWARVPVLQMLSVLAGRPLSSSQVSGRLLAAVRFWTTDRMLKLSPMTRMKN